MLSLIIRLTFSLGLAMLSWFWGVLGWETLRDAIDPRRVFPHGSSLALLVTRIFSIAYVAVSLGILWWFWHFAVVPLWTQPVLVQQ